MLYGGILLMKGYILSIAGVILISAVVAVISPGGKMGKFVKNMTRLFIFVVLITPFVRFAKDPEAFFPATEIAADDGFLRDYAEMLSRKDGEEIALWIKEEFGVGAEAEVSRSFDDFSYEKIVVRVTDFGINGAESHIDILSAIRERLEKTYGCRAEVT